MYHDDPAISLPALDPLPPVDDEGKGLEPDSVVSAIRAVAVALANAIEQAPNDGWNRTGRAAGGPVTALEVVRFAVHLGVHHLRLAEQTITEVVHDLG